MTFQKSQGERLPDTVTYDGEWIIEGEIFLFLPKPHNAPGEFGDIASTDGQVADGFDANWLAQQLNVTVVQLFELNRQGLLRVQAVRVPASRAADRTIEYTIQAPHAGIQQRVSRAAPKGNA